MMGFRCFLAVVLGLLLGSSLFAQSSGERIQSDPSGEWVLTTIVYGENLSERLKLTAEKDQLRGTLFRDEGATVKGTLKGQELQFSFKESGGDQSEYKGRFNGETLVGEYTTIGTDGDRTAGTWSARRIPARSSGGPRQLEFVPQVFRRTFSSTFEPVLHVWPGDTVHTTTVDAGGTDEKGVTRVLGGNPETGPFYIETAMPGDVLVVRLNRVRLNRDWAVSDDGIVGRALDPDFAVKVKDGFKTVRWHLDRQRGVA